MNADILVIGAQGAGMSAASRAKRKNKNLDVLVLEKGPYVSVGTCGLPYFIGDLVREAKKMEMHDVAFFREQREIPILTRHEVIGIDPGAKRVTALSLDEQKEKVFRYDKLIIGTGSTANRPGISGEDLSRVFVLKTLEDGIRIKSLIDQEQPKNAVIIGAGVIGLEMAEAFARRGLHVTLLKRPGSILRMLDDDMTRLVEEELHRQGVDVCLDVKIQKINGIDGRAVSVTCSGQDYPADLVLLATGASPSTGLARSAGLAMGPFGDIVVDEAMTTSDPNIFAAGDCVAQIHRVSQQAVYLPRGTTANKQGRVAGENAAGGCDRFTGVVGTSVAKIFDLHMASTGLNEKAAREAGFDTAAVQIAHPSHGQTYPNPPPEPITVRMVLEKRTGRLLGGQMIGKFGVGKRIDVLATAVTHGLTVNQIGDLDLSYSPPFAPLWDPILVAANAAAKVI
jgi:CoA-dependent NAD(P)H sulfur oxidoreductase